MKTNMPKNHKSGWKHRISPVLIFTMLLGMLLGQGWLSPNRAEAAIATLQGWSNVYTGTARPTAAITYDIPASQAGGSRMLVVAVSSVLNAASGAQTCSVSYGGQALTQTASNFTGNSAYHTALFYLQEAKIQAATNNQLTVTLSAQGTQYTAQVDAAVFDGVDQSASPITSNQSWQSTTTTSSTIGPFATALTIGAGDLAAEAVAVNRTGRSTSYTISTWATGWASAFGPTTQANGTTIATNFYTAHDTTAGTTTSQHTASGSGYASMSAMSIKMLPMDLQVTDGTAMGAANAGQDTANNPLDSFTMAASAGGVTVNTLTLTGSANFTSANIAGISVYRDNGTAGMLDAADVLVPMSYSAITGNATTITFTTPESLTSAAVNYLITVDISATATTGQSITGRITAATGTLGTPSYADSTSATLTIQSQPGLTMGNGTNPASAIAQTTSLNNALDAFTLQTVNANGGTASIDTLTVTGSANFTATNISGVHVYKDNGTTVGTFDGADVLMPSSATAITGNATTLTFSPPIYVTSTAANYLLVVDIPDGATLMATFTGTVTGATGHGLATPTYGDSGSATLTIKRASSITSCATCHEYPPADGTARNNPAGAVVGDHQKHHYVCSTCHVAPATTGSGDYAHQDGMIDLQATVQGGSYSKVSPFAQTNNPTTGTCSNIACHGGNNPTPQWGVGTAQCIDCHNGIVTALTASTISNGAVTQRDNIVAEFGQTWGHRNAARSTANGAVTDADCIVCHLEGDYATQKTSAKHADGYIDLRDPDGAGETEITDISGSTFRFVKFSTSYAPGSRTSNGQLSNNTDNVVTQKFCVVCHDSNGATNPTARSNNGGTGSATMPFGGINLGANYTVANGAAAAGGLVNVSDQFATTNSAYHPVRGPLNRDLPISTRLAAPYDNQVAGRVAAGGVKTNSVVLNCFDCHTTGTSLTNRTIVAHGNANTLRGTIYVSGPTLCLSCHAGYTLTQNHGSGSAMNGSSNGNEGFNTNCHYCHGSNTSTTRPARPLGAQDYHGNNALVGGGLWPTINARPVAFIRGWTGTAYHRGAALAGTSGYAVGSATCGAGTCPSGQNVGNGSNRTYTPGGQY